MYVDNKFGGSYLLISLKHSAKFYVRYIYIYYSAQRYTTYIDEKYFVAADYAAAKTHHMHSKQVE